MAKQKIIWSCQECGHNQTKWTGQCPQCLKWHTLKEEIEVSAPSRFEGPSLHTAKALPLKEISAESAPRFHTDLHELDRLLGGGVVAGSLILVGGEPGIGKSTLLLQASGLLAKTGKKVLYVSGEESQAQTAQRARRIGIGTDNLYLLSETNFAHIKAQIQSIAPDVIVVDSIQMLYKSEIPSAPGSVSQVREAATEFMHLAKTMGIVIFLIGHVTKSGEIAGPRVLEHIVDTVLYFEGERQYNYRMMRVVKNRFGPTDEIAVFQMVAEGLKEVENPSELFLEERQKEIPGSVIIPTLEGSRPILVEVQALVTDTAFANPSRKSSGLDPNRVALLLAVLEKRVGYRLHGCDVFVSAAGGIKISEPAIDLGVLLAIASSFNNIAIDSSRVVIGEVGLGGEVRSVPRIETRLKEAIRMGFTSCLIPKRNMKGISKELMEKIEVSGIDLVEEAIHASI